MSCELIFRPLSGWPRDLSTVRRVRPFKSSLDQTLLALRYELGKLGAKAASVQTAHDERAISVSTGRPRVDINPRHPGVIVAADTRYGALKWVCDDCVRWQDNLHAIALTLERLRLADLYGVTKRGEQYIGWKMLPGPITVSSGPNAATMSIDEAARFVGSLVGRAPSELLRKGPEWQAAYRDAAKKLHPDAGGDPDNWRRLEQARTLLNSFHNK